MGNGQRNEGEGCMEKERGSERNGWTREKVSERVDSTCRERSQVKNYM